mmetsp:Transcript_3572/g.12949  ORF Transcript_3572/g.12949 Transcript_3572/m.12949 type:complete len:218 (+) Transcript_3572:265-918(+)
MRDLSLVMVTESPNTPALPFTLTRSLRNFSKEPISMILSSTGLAQSRTKVFVFFFCLFAPFGAILALNDTKPSQSVVEKERERRVFRQWRARASLRRESHGHRRATLGQGNGTGGWKRTRCDRPEKRKLGHPVAPFPPRAPRHLNPSRSTWSRRDQVRRQRRRVRACVSPASALLALGLSLAPRYVPLLWCCLSLPSPPASWLPVAACSCSLFLSLS